MSWLTGRGMLQVFSVTGFLGLLAGLWVALVPSGVSDNFGGTNVSVAARVNGVVITALDFERAAQAVQNDRRNALGPDEAASVLNTLINEELLIQEAVRIGLPHSDREVRGVAVRAVMRLILSDLTSLEPDEATLRAFYEDNPGLLSSVGRIWVRHMEVSRHEAGAVDEIVTALQEGASFTETENSNSAISSRPVPDRIIRGGDLSQYLGGTLSEYALAAGVGTIIGPIEIEEDIHFLWVVEREMNERPSFLEARETISSEWRRRAEEEAVTTYIERLRNRASVEIETDRLQ